MACDTTGWSVGDDFPLATSASNVTFRWSLSLPPPSLPPSLPPFTSLFGSNNNECAPCRLWVCVASLDAALFVHASLKLPWNLADLATVSKRGAPHTMPLWVAVVGLTGLVSYAVKAPRTSRFSDPDATIEIIFAATSIAIFTGPRFYPPVCVLFPPLPRVCTFPFHNHRLSFVSPLPTRPPSKPRTDVHVYVCRKRER